MNDPHHPVHEALSSHDDYEIVRELHRVRPHATYEIRFRDERAVCKLATSPLGHPEREARVLQHIGRRTSIPVPEVLAVGDDHFVGRWCDEVPGEPQERDEERIRVLGRGLATLHAETAGEFPRTGLLQATADGTFAVDADERWSDTLDAVLEKREQYLDTVGYGHLAREAADWLRRNRDLFDVVDDPVLVHGNYFEKHVGTKHGDVIDFEHALIGSPEWDYLRTVLPVFGPRASHDVPEAVFRDAYESVRPLPPGFDELREGYVALNGVSYLRSLHLQRGNLDARQAVARRARALASSLATRLDDLEMSARGCDS